MPVVCSDPQHKIPMCIGGMYYANMVVCHSVDIVIECIMYVYGLEDL